MDPGRSLDCCLCGEIVVYPRTSADILFICLNSEDGLLWSPREGVCVQIEYCHSHSLHGAETAAAAPTLGGERAQDLCEGAWSKDMPRAVAATLQGISHLHFMHQHGHSAAGMEALVERFLQKGTRRRGV